MVPSLNVQMLPIVEEEIHRMPDFCDNWLMITNNRNDVGQLTYYDNG